MIILNLFDCVKLFCFFFLLSVRLGLLVSFWACSLSFAFGLRLSLSFFLLWRFTQTTQGIVFIFFIHLFFSWEFGKIENFEKLEKLENSVSWLQNSVSWLFWDLLRISMSVTIEKFKWISLLYYWSLSSKLVYTIKLWLGWWQGVLSHIGKNPPVAICHRCSYAGIVCHTTPPFFSKFIFKLCWPIKNKKKNKFYSSVCKK